MLLDASFSPCHVSVGRVVDLVVEQGPALPFPYSSGIGKSRHRHRRTPFLALEQKGLMQEAMAELPGVSQAGVSKTERRAELYVGTLRKFIEAMEGELVLAARFRDGVEVPIRLNESDRAV